MAIDDDGYGIDWNALREVLRQSVQAAVAYAEAVAIKAAKVLLRASWILIGWVWPWGAILGAIALAGLASEWSRKQIIASSPWIARHSKLTADVWNTFGQGVVVSLRELKNGINLIKMAVFEVENVVFHKHKAMPPLSAINPFHTVSATEIAQTFNKIPIECEQYTTPWDIATGSLKNAVGHDVCKTLRAFYPTPWRTLLEKTIGRYSNSGYAPAPYGENCDEPTPPMPWFCAPLGSGAIIIEVIIPAALGIAVVIAVWKAYLSVKEDAEAETVDYTVDQLASKNN